MRMLTEAEVERELGRILQTQDWPLGSCLPVKNLYNSKYGFICATSRGVAEPVVYEGNLLELDGVHANQVSKLPSTVFASIEEMVRAGWVGD